MMKQRFSLIPPFILKYNLETGNKDEIISYDSSLKLKTEFKNQDTLIVLGGQKHNGIKDNEDYKATVRKILLR